MPVTALISMVSVVVLPLPRCPGSDEERRALVEQRALDDGQRRRRSGCICRRSRSATSQAIRRSGTAWPCRPPPHRSPPRSAASSISSGSDVEHDAAFAVEPVRARHWAVGQHDRQRGDRHHGRQRAIVLLHVSGARSPSAVHRLARSRRRNRSPLESSRPSRPPSSRECTHWAAAAWPVDSAPSLKTSEHMGSHHRPRERGRVGLDGPRRRTRVLRLRRSTSSMRPSSAATARPAPALPAWGACRPLRHALPWASALALSWSLACARAS